LPLFLGAIRAKKVEGGQPAPFRPALPWYQPFVFSYLSITGWA
jgi:hypothetical protein